MPNWAKVHANRKSDPLIEVLKTGLYQYQRDWLADPNRLKVCVKARQIGWSFIFAVEAVINANAEDKKDQLIVSASERQAAKVLDKAEKFAEVCMQLGVPFKITSISESRIKFASGTEILSLPQNPNTVRGFSGDLYLDEFAMYRDADAMYSATFPIITRGHKLRIGSTPLGESGKFWDIWTGANSFFKYKCDIYKAVKGGLELFDERGEPTTPDFIRRNMDEESFRREYLCEFIDESSAYFPFDLIFACVGERQRNHTGSRFIGIDVARKHDFTAVCVLEQLGEHFQVVRLEVMKGANYETQKRLIRRVIEAEDVKRGLIDESGLGGQMAEELSKEYPSIRPLYFTNDNKEEMAVSLKRLFEDKSITIPDDKDLINDIHSIKRHVTASGNFRFDAERNAEGHADRFWALGLALQASRRKPISVRVY